MPNSLNTAVSGLLAHQRQLDMVANNLANMNTTGYKSQRIVFSDLMYELLSPATSGNGISVGGTNPIQVGSGVRTGQIGRDFGQGGFNATGQPLDFALQGDGFFVLGNGNGDSYSRSGAFTLDQNGYLIDPATGYHVQRFGSAGEPGTGDVAFQIPGDDRIRVPLGETILGQATETVNFNGVLDAQVDGPAALALTSANPFEAAGNPATVGTLLNDLTTNLVDYQAGDTIDISGVNADGSPFNVSLVVGPASTLGDLVNGINSNLTGGSASVDSLGNLVVTADDTGQSMVSVTFRDTPGNVGQSDFHIHSLVVTTPGAEGETFSGKLDIYDVRGGERSLGYVFQKVGLNTWDLTFDLPDGDGTVIQGSIPGIEFSDDGTLVGVGGVTNSLSSVTLAFDDILQQQTFSVDISELVQIANPFSMSIEQDGLEPGKLANVRVNSDGTLDGISSTGQSFEIAQLAIAIFRNPQGLNAVGNSYFEESLNSGPVELGAAASGGRGAIRGGQLEGSNVDVAFEFTQLIVAQRGFSANARTITVADEVLEELTNIIR